MENSKLLLADNFFGLLFFTFSLQFYLYIVSLNKIQFGKATLEKLDYNIRSLMSKSKITIKRERFMRKTFLMEPDSKRPHSSSKWHSIMRLQYTLCVGK